MRDLFPRMERLVTDTVRATYDLLDPKRHQNSFEIFGYDFMIDDDLDVFLIEVNTNPCLETTSCPLMQKLIPQMVDQSFKIAVDPFLRGKDQQYSICQEMSIQELNYEMIYSNCNVTTASPAALKKMSRKEKESHKKNLLLDRFGNVKMNPDKPQIRPIVKGEVNS